MGVKDRPATWDRRDPASVDAEAVMKDLLGAVEQMLVGTPAKERCLVQLPCGRALGDKEAQQPEQFVGDGNPCRHVPLGATAAEARVRGRRYSGARQEE